MTDYIIKPMETAEELDAKGYVRYKSWQETCKQIAHKWLYNVIVAKNKEKLSVYSKSLFGC